MRAVTCQNAELEVVERPEPVPGAGQVRIEVLRCGICGSDLHARHGCDDWAALAAKIGYDRFARSSEPIVFGHEFCGAVAEHGPGCRRDTSTGMPVVALPLLRGGGGVDTVGLSVHAPGGYAQYEEARRRRAETTQPRPTSSRATPSVGKNTATPAAAAADKKQRSPSTLRRLIGVAEADMEKAIAARDAVLADLAAAGNDHVALTRIAETLAGAEARLSSAEERWLELSEELGA